MRHLIKMVWVAGIALMFLGACSSDGTSELKSLLNKQIDMTESFAENVEKAKTTEDMAAAIEDYTADMKELLPKLQKFHEKHPDFNKDGMTEKLEDEVERMKMASAKLSTAMMGSMGYMMDAKVQEAMRKMAEEIGDME